MAKQGKQYSAKEKKAFYIGVGASLGFGRTKEIKKATSKMTVAEKKSLYNGFQAQLDKRRQ